jgi:hypothetical protein
MALDALAYAAVALAAVFLGRRYWPLIRRKKAGKAKDCGSDCACGE